MWFTSINAEDAFFVTRLKGNAHLEVTEWHFVPPVASGVMLDETVIFAGAVSGGKFSASLGKVVFHDTESGKTYEFLVNNFNIAAAYVSAIYKRRWQIELFFKWIKQNLKKKLSGDVRQCGHDADMGGADALPARGVHQVFKWCQTDSYSNQEQAAGDADERLRPHGVAETGSEGAGKVIRLEQNTAVDAFRGVFAMKNFMRTAVLFFINIEF